MNHWSDQGERSNLFWLSALRFVATVLGRGSLRLLCVPIAFFFLLSAGKARAASQQFLNKVLPHSPSWWHTFRHFYEFALVSSDRLLFLSGKWDKFNLDIEGEDIIRAHDRDKRGCLLLVSHLGSFDVMRVPAVEQEHFRLRILIDKQHNPAAIRVIQKLNPELAADMIDAAAPSASLVLTLHEALSKGEMIGIMADRAAQKEPIKCIEFLGEKATFPTGPWMLAMALKVPIVLCFGTYQGGNNYRIRFHQISDGESVPRSEREQRLQENMRQYASVLGQYAKNHPFNWFNFYDFWADASTEDK